MHHFPMKKNCLRTIYEFYYATLTLDCHLKHMNMYTVRTVYIVHAHPLSGFSSDSGDKKGSEGLSDCRAEDIS